MSITAKKIYVDSEAAWLEQRRLGIGGSDAGAVAGVDKYRTPMTVFLDKIAAIDGPEETERMYMGKKMEATIADIFAEKTGFQVEQEHAVLQHSEHPFMQVNLDRVIHSDEGMGVLECKNRDRFLLKQYEEEGPTGSEILQVTHGMMVSGLGYGYLAVVVGGNRFFKFRIERDEQVIEYLAKIECDFWRLVETKTPPPLDEASLTVSTLNLLYPSSNGQTIVLPDAAATMIQHYQAAGEVIKKWKGEQDKAKMELQALLGEAEAGTIGGKLVKWRTTTRKGYVVEPSTYRDFRICNLKEKN